MKLLTPISKTLNKGKIILSLDISEIAMNFKIFKEVKIIFFLFMWGKKLRCSRLLDPVLTADMVGEKHSGKCKESSHYF